MKTTAKQIMTVKLPLIVGVILFVCFVLFSYNLFISVSAENIDETTIESKIEKAFGWENADYSIEGVFSEELCVSAGSSSSEWFALAYLRYADNEYKLAYLNALNRYVKEKYKTEEKLDRIKTTEWHRISLAVAAAGGNPTDFGGVDLIADGTYTRTLDNIGAQGINGYIWALIALDCKNYAVPLDGVTRSEIIGAILKKQLSSGGFCFFGSDADVDMTAAVVYALSPYYNNEDYVQKFETPDGTLTVTEAINKALDCLSKLQCESGGYKSMGVENSQSAAQVIIALTSLNISPETDARFIKEKSVLSAFEGYICPDGGFANIKTDGTESKPVRMISTYQGALALVAVDRFNKGKNRLFDLTDVDTALIITENDLIQLQKLSEGYSVADYLSAGRLNYLFEFADNSESYKMQLKTVEDIFEKINYTNNEIREINSVLQKMLSENLKTKDYKTLLSVFDRISALSEFEQSKITEYGELTSALKRLKTIIVSRIIFVVLSVAAVCAVGGYVLYKASKKRKKNAEKLSESDE